MTFFREKIFYECFDYFVIGQCENTFGIFLNKLADKKDVSEIPGLLFRKNNSIIFTGENQQITVLDDVLFPARHLLKLDLYTLGTLEGKEKIYFFHGFKGLSF